MQKINMSQPKHTQQFSSLTPILQEASRTAKSRREPPSRKEPQRQQKPPLILFALSFFKIALFCFGGGYAMLSLVEKEFVHKLKVISKEEFWNLISVVQILPGVFAFNTALYLGKRLYGFKGALLSSICAILPSVLIILCIAIISFCFEGSNSWLGGYLEAMFKGVRPCVIALITSPAISLYRLNAKNAIGFLYPIACFLLLVFCKVSPILIIGFSLSLGLVFSLCKQYKK